MHPSPEPRPTDATHVVIRRLEIDDAPAYRERMLEAYATHPEAFGSTPEERAAMPLSWWEARIASDGFVVGAFADGELCGVAGVSFERREKLRHKARLFGVFVSRARRREGVGEALVSEAVRAALERPECLVLQVSVSEDNASARALYERCGFREYGVEPYAMRAADGFHGHVHLWRPLREDLNRRNME